MIVLFNGPPGTGKDVCADYVRNKFGFKKLSFKTKLFECTADQFGVCLEWFMKDYDNRVLKETPMQELKGYSRRQALIYTSEEVIKPAHGKSYFGKICANEIMFNPKLNYCFSDCGFYEEFTPLINTGEQIIIVQLTRDGCDFLNDSRRYLEGDLKTEYVLSHRTNINKDHIIPEKLQVPTYRIHNNDTQQSLETCLCTLFTKELNDYFDIKEKNIL